MLLAFPLKSPKGFDALLRHSRRHRRSAAFLPLLGKFLEKLLSFTLILFMTFTAFVLFSILRPAQTAHLQKVFEESTHFERPIMASSQEGNAP
jgi:hypothetical protein